MKWVNNNLIAHEEFIGMYHIRVTKGDTVVRVIKDSMLRLNLKLSDVQGQCFDGTAAMAEKKSGMTMQMKSLNGKILFTHAMVKLPNWQLVMPLNPSRSLMRS